MLYISNMELKFKKWLENSGAGGFDTPPMQSPIDPEPAPGQTDAFQRYHFPGSDELPVQKKKLVAKKMKKK